MNAECKVLNYNILHELPVCRRLEDRLDLIADEIAAQRPHVVALQEVSRTATYGDTGAALCARVNARGGNLYRLDYARADGAGEGEYAFEHGLALMARLDPFGPPETLKYEAQVRLTTEFAGHSYRVPDDRIAMRGRYRVANGIALDVCVTHLTDRREAIDGVPTRVKQAHELARWLDRDRSAPIVLAGDFNDVPESATIGAITDAGFIDLWAKSGTGPGFTNDRDDLDLESESGSPNQRIDYLFFRLGQASSFEIADVQLFLDRPRVQTDGGWLWGSDHIGVLATIRL